MFLISFVGEFGSSTNISFRYMMSNPKFPNIKHPETIGKFFELFAVSFTTGYLLVAWPGMVYRIIKNYAHKKPSSPWLVLSTIGGGLWILYTVRKVLSR